MFNYIFLMTKTNYNNRILLFYILHFNISQRIIYVALGIVAFLIAYSAGAAVHMGKQQTEDLKRHFAEQIRGIDQNGIFINNVRIALGMFVPAAGIGLGVISGFYTGMIFTAIAATSALNNVPPLVILITPFGIMEVFRLWYSDIQKWHIHLSNCKEKVMERICRPNPYRDWNCHIDIISWSGN